jgi:hypothetical protein
MQNKFIMNKFKAIVLAAAFMALSHPVNAQVLFSDNFNSDNGGATYLNYGVAPGTIPNWNITRGSIDLLGAGFFGAIPLSYGAYIDTEGSTGAGGTMVTMQSFNFVPGVDYTLSFDLAGDQRSGGFRSEIVTVGAGGSILDKDINLLWSDPIQLYSYSFTVGAATSSPLSFAAGEDGDIGLILDNVTLSESTSTVPDGANTAMLAAGALLALAGVARSRKCAVAVR